MNRLEQAVLRTMAYADIFDYPLSISEIQKYLIKHVLQYGTGLGFLFQKHSLPLVEYQGYFFLKKQLEESLPAVIQQRRVSERRAHQLLSKAKQVISKYLVVIPWIKLLAVTGSTAALNADESADIDLFIITQNGRKWITRASVLFILERIEQRVNLRQAPKENGGKFCLNMIFEETEMGQKYQD